MKITSIANILSNFENEKISMNANVNFFFVKNKKRTRIFQVLTLSYLNEKFSELP